MLVALYSFFFGHQLPAIYRILAKLQILYAHCNVKKTIESDRIFLAIQAVTPLS
ncbi:MAG: hypothetical protein RM368_23210 [Nostoc sp. DedSLP03]|nr:hypothetical protein [Nostoc sp. DedSLP03]